MQRRGAFSASVVSRCIRKYFLTWKSPKLSLELETAAFRTFFFLTTRKCWVLWSYCSPSFSFSRDCVPCILRKEDCRPSSLCARAFRTVEDENYQPHRWFLPRRLFHIFFPIQLLGWRWQLRRIINATPIGSGTDSYKVHILWLQFLFAKKLSFSSWVNTKMFRNSSDVKELNKRNV